LHPEQYGGAGFDYISLGLVCEELRGVRHVSFASRCRFHVGTEQLERLQLGYRRAEAKSI
jgi:hypothetical protein